MNGAAHAAEEPDEATRILQTNDAIAPCGDVQAIQTARPAGAAEPTAILVHAGPAESGDADEERTTILQALPQMQDAGDDLGHAVNLVAFDPPLAVAQPSSDHLPVSPEQATFNPADEPTTILASGTSDGGSEPHEQQWQAAAPAWGEQAHLPAGAALAVSEGADVTDEDEPTTILTAAIAEDDEQTTILQQDQSANARHAADAAPGGKMETVEPPPAQTPVFLSPAGQVVETRRPDTVSWTASSQAQPPEAGAHDAYPQEATSILPVAEPPPGAPDSTEILPASGLASLPDTPDDAGGQVSGRAWFDRRLRDFNHALLHTQAGQRRPAAERQALAAAARDMIQRVSLLDPEHRPGEWADSVLQADQLLVNTYFVRALIARGGVGEIYRARHRDLKTEHAIKILLPRYALDPTVLNLMLEEARLLQRVRHEAVVGCQGLLRDTDGRPMLVMDYLRGRTLSARLRHGPLPQAELIRLAARLASGLSALHAQGLVHQDISPDNIILVDDNCAAATIIDFGLARSLDAPENTHRNIDFAGKFSWCSPEQLSSHAAQVDARSDLYSLGLVLAAAARGTRLDMGTDLASARAARHSVPPLGGLQEPIATLLRHLLAPSTATRLRSAEEVPDWLRTKRPSFVQRMFGR